MHTCHKGQCFDGFYFDTLLYAEVQGVELWLEVENTYLLIYNILYGMTQTSEECRSRIHALETFLVRF